MKTLINAVSVVAVVLTVIVSVMGTVAQVVPVVVCLVLVILFFRAASASIINNHIVEDTSVLDTKFVSLSDDVGFELFMEFIEEEDFDVEGDFSDGVIVCWISNPDGVAMTEEQLQKLVDMQAFLTKWA